MTLRTRDASRWTRCSRALVALGVGAATWVTAEVPAAWAAETDDPWVLQEFDWGDSRELVDESVRYSLPFTCNALAGRCALPVVEIDGEDLLVRFAFYQGLYRIRILTPDLTRDVADVHAERVWKLLADYVTRHKGEPEKASAELPAFDAVSEGETHVTHRWKLDDQEIRLGLGRRDDGQIYVAATFVDPVRARRLEASQGGASPSGGEAEEPDGS